MNKSITIKILWSVFFALSLLMTIFIVISYQKQSAIYREELLGLFKPVIKLRHNFQNICKTSFDSSAETSKSSDGKATDKASENDLTNWQRNLQNPDVSELGVESSVLLNDIALEPLADDVAMLHVHLKPVPRPLFAKESILGFININFSPIKPKALISFRIACDQQKFLFILHRIEIAPDLLPKELQQ